MRSPRPSALPTPRTRQPLPPACSRPPAGPLPPPLPLRCVSPLLAAGCCHLVTWASTSPQAAAQAALASHQHGSSAPAPAAAAVAATIHEPVQQSGGGGTTDGPFGTKMGPLEPSPAGGYKQDVWIPETVVGRFIGKGGANLKQLQWETQCHVSVDHDRTGGTERRVTITAPSADAIAAARNRALQLIGPLPGQAVLPQPDASDVRETFYIAKDQVGLSSCLLARFCPSGTYRLDSSRWRSEPCCTNPSRSRPSP